ncbi:MAG: hypothetical protein Q8L29_03990 [archaeon]|nr:hypothetical protein [archaeon]
MDRKDIFNLSDLKSKENFTLDNALKLPAGIQLDVIIAQILTPHVFFTYKDSPFANRQRAEEYISRFFLIRGDDRKDKPLELWEYKYQGGHGEGYYPRNREGVCAYSGCFEGSMELLSNDEGFLYKWGKNVNLHFLDWNKLNLKIGDKDYGTGDTSMIICKTILKTMWHSKNK